ncbi:MAG: alpha-amylase family glycosyl hydrolase, partial [Oscillospiraceae bacterium]
QDGCHEIIAQMRKDVLSRYDCFTVGETVFVSPKEGKELCDKARGELDMIFYFEHMDVDCFFMKYFDRPFSPRRFIKTISKWQGALEWNANYFENHDQPRSVSRFGNDKRYWEQSAKLLATMLFSLRGTPFMFQGEEIGMTNADFESMDDIKDAESRGADAILQKAHMPAWLRWKMIKSNTRDNARTPFQWSNDTNAGFTAGTPWLRLNGNYKRINLKQQKKDPFSVRNYYKDMICIRSVSDTLKYGKFKLISARGPLVVYERSHEGRHATVLLNFSRHPRRMRYSGQVVVSSAGREAYDGVLQPYEAVILNGGTKV